MDSNWTTISGGGRLWKVGPTWRECVTGDVLLKGVSWPWTLPLIPMCFLASVRWTASSSTATSVMTRCLTAGPKQWIQSTLDWNLWNHEPKLILPPFSSFSKVFGQWQKIWHIHWPKIRSSNFVLQYCPDDSCYYTLIWLFKSLLKVSILAHEASMTLDLVYNGKIT
jgi:hypothetical protein